MSTTSFDPAKASDELVSLDPRFADIREQVGPYAVIAPEPVELFSQLVRSVISQQLSTAAARTIYERVVARYGPIISAQSLAEASVDDLRSLGVSGPKVRTIHALVDAAANGRLPTADEITGLSDAEVIGRLTALHGIGEWTAHMILIFGLGRPDVLAHGDLGVRKGAQILLGLPSLPTPRDLIKLGQMWAPWRSIASWYLWRSLEA